MTAETLYFEKYLIVLRGGSLANDLQTPIRAISRHCRVPCLIQYAHSRQTTFYEGQEIGVSKPSVHFIKHPQQEMSLSVQYPLSRSIKRPECCVMAYLDSTGNHPIRQWHSNGPSGSNHCPSNSHQALIRAFFATRHLLSYPPPPPQSITQTL